MTTYRGHYDPAPAMLDPFPGSSLWSAPAVDLGDPARYGTEFIDSGLQWVQFIDQQDRAWWVPMFEGTDIHTALPLWDWGEIRRRNERGYAHGAGYSDEGGVRLAAGYSNYRAAEKRLIDRLGLTLRPQTWIEAQSPIVISGAYNPSIAAGVMGRYEEHNDFRVWQLQDGTPIDKLELQLTGTYPKRAGLFDEPWPGVSPLTPYGSGTGSGTSWWRSAPSYLPRYLGPALPSEASTITNVRVNLKMNGALVFCIGNPWLRIAMPIGLPGDVSSDNGAFEVFNTFIDVVKAAYGYWTANVVMMAAAAYDLVETWWNFANAGKARSEFGRKVNEALRGEAGALGGHFPDASIVSARRRGKHEWSIVRRKR